MFIAPDPPPRVGPISFDAQTAALLVPHSAILDGAVISAPFVRAHTIVLNPENAKQFLTLNGLFGALVKVTVAVDEEEERYVHVLQPDPPPAETLNPLVDVPSYFASVKRCFEQAKSVRSISVLREVRHHCTTYTSLFMHVRQGEISLRGKTVSIFIIAEPLVTVDEAEAHKPPPSSSVTQSSSGTAGDVASPSAPPTDAVPKCETHRCRSRLCTVDPAVPPQIRRTSAAQGSAR